MANHHFGKFADVWKHLVVNEVLAGVSPLRYAETHAGSAVYPIVTDAERQYGVVGFLDDLDAVPILAATPYARTLTAFMRTQPPTYPGSAVQAMKLLGDSTTYLLCDLDPASARSLRDWATRLGVRRCQVVQADGMTSVRDWIGRDGGAAVVHIDPFDPFAREGTGPSAVELAADIAVRGHALVYWYGFSRPDDRAWAFDEIASDSGVPLWCGELMVTTLEGEARRDGDLGEATTPGTGAGVVLANVRPEVLARCEELAYAMVRRYASVTLPTGEPGRLDYRRHTTPD